MAGAEENGPAREADSPEPPVLGVARSASGRTWRWRSAPLPLETAASTAAPELAAQLLLARGAAPADLRRWLRPTLRDWLPDPSAFRDMDAAAERIIRAIEQGEAITLLTDYDVDGATSAAILIRLLRAMGAAPRAYVPDRLLEGYGPSTEAVLKLAAEGTKLLILLDCGTHAFAEVDAARAAGVDVIIVDHHKAGTALPAALSVVNPNRFDEQAEGGIAADHAFLCTAGLAFLLACAIRRTARGRLPQPDLSPLLDLVALGTVADVMPLVGLNRAFVALGLKRLAARGNAGLSALLDVAGLATASAGDLGFHLGPRVNAGGRVGTADLGVRLLTTEDAREAERIARELDALNAVRREIEMAVTSAALASVDEKAPVAVAAGEGWHPGVIGIAAARVKERLGRPAIVIATDGNRPARGSGRSIAGVDLGAAILAARERGLLIAGGGHAMAAGLSVDREGIPALAAFLAERLGPAIRAAGADRHLAIDLAIAPRALTPALEEALTAAGPYGQGWPAPRVAVGRVRLLEARPVGDGTHVRVVGMGADGARLKAILFRGRGTSAGEAMLASAGRCLHLAGRVVRWQWQGQVSAELHLDDVARAD